MSDAFSEILDFKNINKRLFLSLGNVMKASRKGQTFFVLFLQEFGFLIYKLRLFSVAATQPKYEGCTRADITN